MRNLARTRSTLGFAVVLVTACVQTLHVGPPTDAAELLRRHIAAIGGAERLAAIHSLQIAGILNERGTLHPLFADRERPNRLRVRMMHGGELVFTESYDGTRSWEGAPGKENCSPDSAASAATRRAAEQFDDAFISAMSRAARSVYVGRVRLGDDDLLQVDVTRADGAVASYYLDPATYLLRRLRDRRPLHPTEPVRTIEVVFDDYRAVSGVLFPFRSIERDVQSGEPLTVGTALWMEANVPIAGNPYERPATCT